MDDGRLSSDISKSGEGNIQVPTEPHTAVQESGAETFTQPALLDGEGRSRIIETLGRTRIMISNAIGNIAQSAKEKITARRLAVMSGVGAIATGAAIMRQRATPRRNMLYARITDKFDHRSSRSTTSPRERTSRLIHRS